MPDLSADIAILGSGFGGSLTALIAERLGLRPVVVDKAAHPRFAVGESSTPVANMILRDLAGRYGLAPLHPLSTYGSWQEAYPHLVAGRKRGFSYFYHRPGAAFRHAQDHSDELLVAASSDPYHCDTHWLRADVDAFLAEQVRQAGIPLLEDTAVTSVRRGSGRREGDWRLRGRRGSGAPLRIRASFLVDATGRGGVLPAALGLPDRTGEMQTRSRALFSHFSGVKPWQETLRRRSASHVADHPFPCDQAALHHVTAAGWMWLLRFNNGVTSAGLVLDDPRPPASRAPGEEWERWMRRYPSIRAQFADAEIVAPPGALVQTGRLQRKVGQAAGPGWALLPHTAGFVDPIHSTGIAHTLAGVERLACLLSAHWDRPTMAQALGDYDRALLQELAFVDELAALYYRSLSHFRLVASATMCYFAAATTYERLRARHQAEPSEAGAPFEHLFLCAGDSRLRRSVKAVSERLGTLRPCPDSSDVDAFERYASARLAPYNEVGLFHPPVPNMYPHTAAPA